MGYVLPPRYSSESRISRHGQEEELYSPEEGAAKMTPSPLSDHQTPRGYTEEDPYAETRHRRYRPGPESQLADQYQKIIHAEKSREFTPHLWSTTQRSLPQASQTDPLHRREEQLSATLAEIRETRSELKLLAETVRSLQQTPQPAITRSQSSTSDPLMPAQTTLSPLDYGFVPPPCAELVSGEEISECDEVDWPDPPPWPEPEEPQPISDAPIVDLLEKMMSELQVLKQAAFHPSRTLTAPTVSFLVRDFSPSVPQKSRMLSGHSSQRQSLHPQPPPRAGSAYTSEQYESYLQAVKIVPNKDQSRTIVHLTQRHSAAFYN
ncbi:hypothetical protein DPX16_0270 [Anabarilius grahami]|uniref:Uncharacterized protein n=1 Tax=Anabarilius grahami TaxID=495550 RepID=A0A3N0Z8U5_ANAGA|nr:hypothetical protein DPX16_0270 [Anabarilius grahami]